MRINADFSQRVLVHAARHDWVPSPMAGVERRMLDRIGKEVARATSIVRYAPKSAFSHHTHDGGEEFFVLEGVFQDEHGDFPAGSYIRNPPGTSHTPGSEYGCTIFVKLHQFDSADRVQLRLNTRAMGPVSIEGRPKARQISLFKGSREEVRIEFWEPGASIQLDCPGGFEALVLEGSYVESGDALGSLSWLRLPVRTKLDALAGDSGTTLWIKTGHLAHV